MIIGSDPTSASATVVPNEGVVKYSLLISPEFLRNAAALPKDAKAKLIKCLSQLSANVRHPGLHSKRIQGSNGSAFECRVDKGIRLVYDFYGSNIRCWYVGSHDPALRIGESIIPASKRVIVEDIHVGEKVDAFSYLSEFLNKGRIEMEFVSMDLEMVGEKLGEGAED